MAELTDDERARYAWQLWVDDFGERGQQALKSASVLVSRVGGLGSVVAYELAAAGIGRLVIAHAGDIKPSDLNRQLLMTTARLGTSRIECAKERLNALNPACKVIAVPDNVSEHNASELVRDVDVVIDCAPLFDERFAMNRACVAHRKPLVECAMYDLECTLTSLDPGRTPCLACLSPTAPRSWKREFPVFGAVSCSVGGMAAMEAIKIIAGFGEPLFGRLLRYDLRTMATQTIAIHRRPDCPVCAGSGPVGGVERNGSEGS